MVQVHPHQQQQVEVEEEEAVVVVVVLAEVVEEEEEVHHIREHLHHLLCIHQELLVAFYTQIQEWST